MPFRDLLLMANHEASDSTTKRMNTSNISMETDLGSGAKVVGTSYSVSKSGRGKRCCAETTHDVSIPIVTASILIVLFFKLCVLTLREITLNMIWFVCRHPLNRL